MLSITGPIVGFGTFAVNKYLYSRKLPANTVITCFVLFALHEAFNYGVYKDRMREYSRMYELYGTEVNDSKYRGLKLYKGKHVNEIKERQYTSSNIDELRLLLNS